VRIAIEALSAIEPRGFALVPAGVLDHCPTGVAPFPCTYIVAEIVTDAASVRVERLLTGDVAVLERRVFRHCLEAIRKACPTAWRPLPPRPRLTRLPGDERPRPLRERLGAEWIAGAEEEWRRRTGRSMTAGRAPAVY